MNEELKSFKFLKTWSYSLATLITVLALLIGFLSSFSYVFSKDFLGVIILAAPISILITYGIKWYKKGFRFEQPLAPNLTEEESKKLKGIRGVLVIVIISLFLNLIIQIYAIYSFIQILTNKLEKFSGFLKFELIISIVLSIAIIYLIHLFFRKDRNFPKYYVYFLVSAVIIVMLHYGIIYLLFDSEEKILVQNIMSKWDISIIRTFLSAIIWGLYITKSKRVRATFIN